MEGIPRVPMICPEMKAPDSASLPEQFADRIREYIAVHYQDDPSKFNAAFSELAALRAAVARGIPDVETLCVMKRYYAQLVMVKNRFPMEEHDPAAVPFSWIDRTSDMPSSITYEDINFELCSVMFNIGAMHAAIAVSETRSELDSVKNAFMHFLWAAWPLKQLRDEMGAKRFQSSVDFEDPYLTFHLNVLLAQAYECMLERSMIQCRTPSLIAQIAYHVAEIYKNCRAHVEHSGLDDLITSSRSREWKSLSVVKAKLYEAIGHFYMAVCEEDKSDAERSHGLKTSYLLVAMECIDSAMKDVRKDKRESLKQAVAYAHDVIKQKTDNAKKENDVVYHERLTKKEELVMPKILPQVESAVKPSGFDPCDYSISGEDLFKALLPTNVIKAVSLYSEEKAKFRRRVIEKVESKDTDLEEYLLSLQLDQLNFDQPMGLQRLPDELLQSSAAYSSHPDGLPELLLQFEKVADLSTKAEHKLSDLSNRLKAINDPEMKSDEGYATISKNLDDLTKYHEPARTSNIELQRAIAAHSENLKLLAMPITELTHEVCGKVINPSDTEEGKHLRRMLDKVDDMRRQRCQLLEDLKGDLDRDDITSKALAEKELNTEKLFETELKKHDKVVNTLEQNMVAQENILRALTEANANFADLRRQIFEGNESRAEKSLALISAYQVYVDVKEKTRKALIFYEQLFGRAAQLEKLVGIMESALEGKLAKQREEESRANRNHSPASSQNYADMREQSPLTLPSFPTDPLPRPAGPPRCRWVKSQLPAASTANGAGAPMAPQMVPQMPATAQKHMLPHQGYAPLYDASQQPTYQAYAQPPAQTPYSSCPVPHQPQQFPASANQATARTGYAQMPGSTHFDGVAISATTQYAYTPMTPQGQPLAVSQHHPTSTGYNAMPTAAIPATSYPYSAGGMSQYSSQPPSSNGLQFGHQASVNQPQPLPPSSSSSRAYVPMPSNVMQSPLPFPGGNHVHVAPHSSAPQQVSAASQFPSMQPPSTFQPVYSGTSTMPQPVSSALPVTPQPPPSAQPVHSSQPSFQTSQAWNAPHPHSGFQQKPTQPVAPQHQPSPWHRSMATGNTQYAGPGSAAIPPTPGMQPYQLGQTPGGYSTANAPHPTNTVYAAGPGIQPFAQPTMQNQPSLLD